MVSAVDNKKENNFDAIRILAALAVLYSHQFALMGMKEPSVLGIHSLGGVAVCIFFSISGYLVSKSWYADPSVLRFSLKRFLRIWPALTAVVIFSVFILGPIVSSSPLEDYFNSPLIKSYLSWIWMGGDYYLPGVFEENPFKGGVNGSLWTIPLEVKCYVVLAFLGMLRILRWRWVFGVVIIFYLSWFLLFKNPDLGSEIIYSRYFGAFFFFGSFMFLTEKYWVHKKISFSLCFFILSSIFYFLDFYHLLLLFVIPMLSVFIGTARTKFFSGFGRLGDPSYGIYLFAFPVQQTIIMIRPEIDFFSALLSSIFITVLFAYISWHMLEKKALKLKPKTNT